MTILSRPAQALFSRPSDVSAKIAHGAPEGVPPAPGTTIVMERA